MKPIKHVEEEEGQRAHSILFGNQNPLPLEITSWKCDENDLREYSYICGFHP